MNYQKLKKHIIALATLPENDSPVVSAYFDLRVPAEPPGCRLEVVGGAGVGGVPRWSAARLR